MTNGDSLDIASPLLVEGKDGRTSGFIDTTYTALEWPDWQNLLRVVR